MALRPWGAAGGPDDETLRRLVVDEALTDRQIGEMYGVSDETVRYYRLRANPPIEKDRAPRRTHKDVIPWTLNVKHANAPAARLLRAWNRREHGDHISEEQSRAVDRFLEEARTKDLVVDYDWEKGFVSRHRDPKLDRPGDLVRRPS